MIFTECVKCNETIIYPYEAGDKPCGDVFDRVLCEKCGEPNYIQRTSFDGETLDEAEAKKRGLIKLET